MAPLIIFPPVGPNTLKLIINTEHHILRVIFRLFFCEIPIQEVLAQTRSHFSTW